MSFRDLQVGDKVYRRMGHNGPAYLCIVVTVGPKHLICAMPGTEHWPEIELWKFDRDLGCEEDEDLKWGRIFHRTGTFLERA